MNDTKNNSKVLGNCKRKHDSKHSSVRNKKFKDDSKFEFGNYNRYYGYRNFNDCTDTRVDIFKNKPELFLNKDVLDIGCNIGHVTYIIARDLSPKTVLGIDIDNSLIRIARKNLRHYVSKNTNILDSKSESKAANSTDVEEIVNLVVCKEINHFSFPNNITFIHSNYVLDHDNLLSLEEPRYDVILCLSVTKWIQLNWGDDGLKRVFRRAFIQLRQGGIFILEAQQWDSYKKKKLNLKLRKNCRDIRFHPNMFHDYLHEIGFKRSEILATPSHSSKGFQRPIKIYYKE